MAALSAVVAAALVGFFGRKHKMYAFQQLWARKVFLVGTVLYVLICGVAGLVGWALGRAVGADVLKDYPLVGGAGLGLLGLAVARHAA